MKLIRKVIIKGELEVLTGLHIGGSSTSMNIGEVDLSVIKSPQDGQPIIPGSSLKGKLRSLLAKLEGSEKVDDDSKDIKDIFGGPDKKDEKGDVIETYITRLIVRDSFLTNSGEILKWEKEGDFTEIKWENTVNRAKGGAEHPRQLERVPKGAKFGIEMILDVYEGEEGKDKKHSKYLPLILKAIELLEDDYLGGSGSRGYGKVSLTINKEDIKDRPAEDYGNKIFD
ncbi:MAG: type III-A CRISPR-associated RAMP protein Csm3 [Prevotellaceae bacterium]|jgi:CRISPR-associated protein Csm3|nr:type III-A CRISPR-associated RAMP protein Csm3 [Prevotellaceae bacterium]